MSLELWTPEDEPMGTASGGSFRWARGWDEARIAELVERLEADPDLLLPGDSGDLLASEFLDRYRDNWKPPYTDADLVAALRRYGRIP